jgi:hypothetical protein
MAYALEAKQGEVAKNRAMKALINTLSHSSHGGELGVARRLVTCYLHYSRCKVLVNMSFHVYESYLCF